MPLEWKIYTWWLLLFGTNATYTNSWQGLFNKVSFLNKELIRFSGFIGIVISYSFLFVDSLTVNMLFNSCFAKLSSVVYIYCIPFISIIWTNVLNTGFSVFSCVPYQQCRCRSLCPLCLCSRLIRGWGRFSSGVSATSMLSLCLLSFFLLLSFPDPLSSSFSIRFFLLFMLLVRQIMRAVQGNLRAQSGTSSKIDGNHTVFMTFRSVIKTRALFRQKQASWQNVTLLGVNN